jgi:hypothetical protein
VVVLEWLVGAAHNSSNWFRGKGVDEGLWVAAVFVVWLLAALAGARVFALLVSPGRKSELGETGWQRIIRIGFLMILCGAAAWTTVGTTGLGDPATTARTLPQLLAVTAVIAVTAGIVMLALGLGQRLRLHINVTGVDGKTDTVKSAYVAARMEALGTSRPRGLEFPHATDVANLPETALSTAAASDSKIAAALLSVFRTVAFIIPWEAEVFIVDSTTSAVTLRRNGRRFDSQLISTSLLLPDNPKNEAADVERAMLTSAAAYILYSLSTIYPALNEGMSGAKNWRGVAAQILATTVPWNKDPQTSTELLARAVDEDPHNLAAWLGYLVKRTGSYGTPKTLEWVLRSLKDLKKELDTLGDAEIALKIRLLRTLTIFSTNLRIQLLSKPEDPESDFKRMKRIAEASSDAHTYATLLLDSVEKASNNARQPRLQEYAQRIRPMTAALYLHVVNLQASTMCAPPEKSEQRESWARRWLWDPVDADPSPRDITDDDMFYLSSPRFHYDRACALLEEDATSLLKPLAHLEFALSLQELRSGAESDPSLKPVHKTAEFAALIEKKVSVSSLTALAEYSEKLASDGIRFASDFVARKDNKRQLAETLKVTEPAVDWMRSICVLAENCPTQEVAASWTNLLTDEGINDGISLNTFVAGLETSNEASRASSARMVRRAEIASVQVPTQEDLRSWAKRVPALETTNESASGNGAEIQYAALILPHARWMNHRRAVTHK